MDPSSALARLLLDDLAPAQDPVALAVRIFGRVEHVPLVAIGAPAALIHRDPWPLLLVADDADGDASAMAVATFVARSWLEAHGVCKRIASRVAPKLAAELVRAPVSAVHPRASAW